MQPLKFLNDNANLMLAVFTAAYVWLTWQMLKALQRASLRDREQRHIEDIRNRVVRPLMEWIDQEAVRKLNGNMLLVQVRTVAVLRTRVALGEPAYDYPRQLNHTLIESQVLASSLYRDVRCMHFAAQFSRLEAFLRAMREFISDCASFARSCADEIAGRTNLPRAAVSGNIPECADSDTFVEVCLRDSFLGRPNPQIYMHVPSVDAIEVQDAYTNGVLGKGLREPIKAWAEGGAKVFRERWAASGLPGRAEELLAAVGVVRQELERLESTYDLPGDCEYLGGKRLGWLGRAKLWLRGAARNPRKQ